MRFVKSAGAVYSVLERQCCIAVKSSSLCGQAAWGQILALLATHRVTEAKLSGLFMPQFPNLEGRIMTVPALEGLGS